MTVWAPPPIVTTPPEIERPHRNRRRAALAFGAVVILGLILGSAFFRLPYYALGPGSVRPTAALISTDGGELYPPTAGVAFPTVSVSRRVTVWQLLTAWLDPEVDVVKETSVLQGRTADQSQQYNLSQMDDAKTVAIKVALEQLGQAHGTGAQVVEIVPDSPAATVLRPGDVVTAIDGKTITSSAELVNAVTSRKPGDTVELSVTRARDEVPDPLATETVSATLAANSDNPTAAFFGVRVQTYFDITFPYDVLIDSGQVGGPSAGLAFTLGVLDMLTPGELTGGQEVVATGTMRPDGSVGPIGGLEHKVDAVKHEGSKLFLVPASQTPAEMAEAQRRAGDQVELVQVHDLDEAIAVIVAHGGTAPGPLVLAGA